MNTTRIVTPTDSEWPVHLSESGYGPDRLFVRGRDVPHGSRSVAIVGTRRPTAAGLEAARNLSIGLVEAGFAIVSGLALGIDGEAHRAALEAGGHTAAVLGAGVNVPHPRRHIRLHERIAEEGTLISEYPDGTAPAPFRFPERNRIIAGLVDAVIVIEGGPRSGALITARFAFDIDRKLYAVPGSIRNAMAFAPNQLIRTSQAVLVTDVKHITDDLAPTLVYQPRSDGHVGPVELSDSEKTVLYVLDDAAITCEAVCRHTGMQAGKAAITLSRLEVRNMVRLTFSGYELTEKGARTRKGLLEAS